MLKRRKGIEEKKTFDFLLFAIIFGCFLYSKIHVINRCDELAEFFVRQYFVFTIK
jgi:hypothetical protein